MTSFGPQFRWPGSVALRPFAWWAGVHLTIWLCLALFFALRFDAGWAGLALHLSVLLAWMVGIAALCAAAAALPGRWARPGRWLCRPLVLLGSLVPVALYGCKMAGNLLWGRDISYNIVLAYAAHLDQVAHIAGATHNGVYAVLGTILAAAASTTLFLRWRAMSAASEALAQSMVLPDGSAPRGRSALWGAIGALMISLSAAQATGAVALPDFHDEPIASLFSGHYSQQGIRAATSAALADIEERDRYVPAAVPRKRNVVILLSDALRADRMQAYGYEKPTTPFLEQLVSSGRAQKVDTALSVCSETICGVHSVLASREAEETYFESFPISALLAKAGYGIHWIMSGFTHDYYELGSLFRMTKPDTLSDGRDCPDLFNDDRCILRGMEALPRDNGQGHFFYSHLHSTHTLGPKHAEFRLFGKETDTAAEYDAGVLQADDTIRQILQTLGSKGYLDDAVVVVTGDHGEALGEHGVWGHVRRLDQEMIHVPIIFWDTRAAARLAETRFGGTVDISPTIAEAIGYHAPGTWTGVSLLHPGDPERRLRHRTRQRRTADDCFAVSGVSGPLTGIASLCRGEEARLFDLGEDPTGRSARDPDTLGAFGEALLGAVRAWEASEPGASNARR